MTGTSSGTSLSSAYAAGVAAVYLQGNPTASPAAVQQSLIDNSTVDKVINPGSRSPNRLLFKDFNNSLALNGSDAYASVANTASLSITGPLTVEAWIKTNSNTTTQGIIERRNNTGIAGNDGGWVLRLISIRQGCVSSYARARPCAISLHRQYGTLALACGTTWLECTMAVRAAYTWMECWMGQLTNVHGLGPGTGNLKIGARAVSDTYFFNGQIDEARVTAAAVYTSNFLPQNHLGLATGTKGLWRFDGQRLSDSSGNNNNGSMVGGLSFSTIVPTNSLSLNGTSSYVQRAWRSWFFVGCRGRPFEQQVAVSQRRRCICQRA